MTNSDILTLLCITGAEDKDMTGKVSGEKVKTTFALGMNVDLSVLSFGFFFT